MKAFILSVLSLLLITFSVSAQETVGSSIPHGKVAVWIYSAETDIADSEKMRNYPILLDGKEVATMPSGRCFVAAILPGKHIFQIGKSKRLKIEMEFKAKQIYYFKVTRKNSKSHRSTYFELQPPEEARKEIIRLKSIDDIDIKDRQIVINKFEG